MSLGAVIIPYQQVALALVLWVVGGLVSWWLAGVVAHSVGRGKAASAVAKWCFRVTFLGLLTVVMLGSLEVAGVPVSLTEILNYPLFVGAERTLLVKNVVTAAVLVLGGLVLSRSLSRMVGVGLVRRRVNATSADAVQKLVFYGLLIGVVFAALEELRVPMTSFAFLGGAVAIGVGFGAQNIINNFISGWILIAERPVRLGDLIEVEGNHGRVESIGARCTRIRRTDGIDMLVPNSMLLENTVVNWTLIDDEIRAMVRVGVVYGSPTDKVVEIIQQTVEEHKAILGHPKPDIIFEDFGDNALIFDVYFWIHAASPMQSRRVCSDVRFRIDALCREAGVIIAFPQRDVHLDMVKPLEVRMVGGDR